MYVTGSILLPALRPQNTPDYILLDTTAPGFKGGRKE